MTLEAFRSLFNLRDLLQEDPQLVFRDGVACVAWTELRKKRPTDSGNHILDVLEPLSTPRMGLLVQLATVDPAYFDLAERMAASSLKRAIGQPLGKFLGAWAANLLVTERPKPRAPNVGHSVMIVTSVEALRRDGWKIYQNVARAEKPRARSGACQGFADALRVGFNVNFQAAAIEKVWKAAPQHLERAGYTKEVASDFLELKGSTT